MTILDSACSMCGIVFGLTERYERERREDHQTFYCPNGHSQYFPQLSDADKARRERDRARDDLARAREELAREKASHRASRGEITKLRNRIAAGLCPYCNRSIKQLRQHVGRKHPEHAADFAKLEAKEREENKQ